MRVLVTGCNGYIGSHVVECLAQHGNQIWGADIDVHGEHNDVGQYLERFWSWNVCGPEPRGEFDAVVHLAGLAQVADSVNRPWDYYRTNVMGTRNVLERIQTRHFIFASTASAWEMASPYARSKVSAEDVIREYTDDYTIFRFFNVSGTNGRYRQLGEATHLIRVAAEVAAGRRDHVMIHGTDYNTRDGTGVRDYVHVLDLARTITESVRRGPTRTPWESIGTDRGYTVLEVLETMRQVTGHAIPVRQGARRQGDAVSSLVDRVSDLVTLRHDLRDMCLSQYLLEQQRR